MMRTPFRTHLDGVWHFTVLACLLTLLALPALAQTRILLVGDSWTEYIWNKNAYPPVLSTYGLSQWGVAGAKTAVGGSTAQAWSENWPNPKDNYTPVKTTLANELAANPNLDIVHLSLGGNDLFAKWRNGMSAGEESAVFDEIQAHLDDMIDFILSQRPDIKVGIVDYDYVNYWELALGGDNTAIAVQALLGNPSPSQLNAAFTNFGLRKRQSAAARNRVVYIHNWGLQQYRHGHPGFWDAGFVYRPPLAPGSVPVPGWPFAYNPYPGGNPIYPGPRDGLDSNGNDPIHLNTTGYKDICASSLGQAFGAWLQDVTGPTVLSITRTGATPTVQQSLGFLVTFSEAVQNVTTSDFTLDITGGISGASITSISGSGATRTVTVNRGTGDGTISIDFIDHDTVYDMNWRVMGNNLGVSSAPGNANYTNGEAYTVDTGPPDVTLTPGIASPTFQSVAPFTAQFTESVTGFVKEDIQLNVTGPGVAQVVNFAGSGATYTFGVSVTLSGDISVNVVIPAGVAVDSSGIGNTAGAHNGFQFRLPPASGGDPYVSDGSLGNLVLSPGNTLAIYTGTGATPPTYRINAGAIIQGQLIDVGTGDLVAKFNFEDVRVPAGVTVTVTGTHPLAIAGTEDMVWNATLDVSGAIAGRAGGGVGGGPGIGGNGGGGGGGGSGQGGGAGRASGGGGGAPNVTGGPGSGRVSGSQGAQGGEAGNGVAGGSGDAGGAGFRAQGSGGSGGGSGAAGTRVTSNNRGAGGSASGGGGGGGAGALGPNNGGNGGGGTANGVDGGTGGTGGVGGSGNDGGTGGHGVFAADANSLALAAGPGGGGGGGGGGGAGGQGGGQGGGGSSGAGGGGGGGVLNTYIAQCGPATNANGGGGGYGGAGGQGQNGGAGGSAGKASNGGTGGNGGGCVVLSARGLLSFGGTVNISASAPTSGGARVARNAAGGPGGGSPQTSNWEGGGGGAGGGQALYWVTLFGCWPQNNYGGSGGSGTISGRGGAGGAGGNSGESGAGGAGGRGVPGMVKLHSSVILAGSGQVVCENHSTSVTSDHLGRYTAISNLRVTPQPNFSDNIVIGFTRNNAVLRKPAPYNAVLNIPLLPDLQGGTATAGFTNPTFWNQANMGTTPGVDLVELVRLAGSASDFASFDQIFLVNNGGMDARDVAIEVNGFRYVIGVIPDGEIWTTTIPNGATLVYEVGMDITIAPESLDLYVGDPLELTATVLGGAGSKTYLWLRNLTQAVQAGPDAVFSKTAALDDAGEYTVAVTDQSHSEFSTNSAVVVVDPRVTITQQPIGATIIVGDSHLLAVTVTGGKGALTYEWQRNGSTIATTSNGFYLVGPAGPGDAGDYTVIVRDTVGAGGGYAESDVATLVVEQPLTVTGPANAAVYEDAIQVQFTVLVSGGITPYTYTWFKDGVAVDLLASPLPQPEGPVLVIDAPLAGRAGVYVCTVEDNDGTVRHSAEGRLTLHPHLSIAVQPVDTGGNPGGTASLSIVAEPGIVPLNYTWYKGVPGSGIPIDQLVPPMVQPNGPVLVFSGLTESMEGRYFCEVADSGTDVVSSDSAYVTVRDPGFELLFTQQPQGGPWYVEDGALTLSVDTSGGMGTVTYAWFFDDGSGDVSAGTGKTLIITNPRPEDSGDYYCVATDDIAGEQSDTATVLVGHRISITQPPQGGSVVIGNDFPFSVVAEGGIGGLTYQWKFDDGQNPVADVGADAPDYAVIGAALADAGAYWVVITDAYTDSIESDHAALVVRLQPFVFTDEPESGPHYIEDGPLVLFAATSGGQGAVQYQWFHDDGSGAAAAGAGQTLTVSAPTTADSGAYYCVAEDELGAITSAQAHIVVGNRIAFGRHPQGGAIVPGSDFLFEVVVSGGIGDLDYQWNFDDGQSKTVFTHIGPNMPEFLLEDADESDTGLYWVVVSDDYEAWPSNQAELIVDSAAGLPAAGLLGLGALAALFALGAAVRTGRGRR